MAKTSSIEITLSVDDRDVKRNLAAIGQSVKQLGLMTETAFAKQNMGVLGVKNFADVKAEMAKLTTAYRDLATSGKASTGELAKALDALRTKQRELYATISTPPNLAAARNTLGVSSHQAIVAEIAKVKMAYATLAASGKLSMAELAHAKVALGGKIDELNKKTNGWREALVGVKGKALEAAAAGAGLVLAAKNAVDFESAMAKVSKTVGGTPGEIAALGTELLKLSRTIPMTAIELANIAAAGGQLGIASKDILPFVEVTAKMATAFDMTAEEAGTAIGKLKNIFSLSIPEMSSFGDAINKLGNTSAAREKDIVDVLLRIGGTARQFGLAREQAAALASAMLSLGKTPETASTAINSLLNRMQTATMQSKEFQEALAKIGTTGEAVAISVEKNPQKAIDQLLATLAKLKGRERAEVLTGLFGKEFQDDIAILVGGLDVYKDSLKQVADKASFAGAMQKEFNVQASTTANQLKTVGNVVWEIGNNIGQAFLPILKAVAAGLQALLQPVANFTAAFPRISAGIASLAVGGVVFVTLAKTFDILKLAFLKFGGESVAALSRVGTAAGVLRSILSGLFLRILAPLGVGFEIGTLLNKFDIVQKAGIAMAGGLTAAWLRVKMAWAQLTGGDVEAVRKEIAEADRIYSEMFASVGRKAQETAGQQVAAQKTVTAAVQASAGVMKKATGEALKEMQDKYKEYATEIRRIQGEIIGEEKSLSAQLREMSRTGMSDKASWDDRKREAAEYAILAKAAATEARAAFATGDTITAGERWKEAIQYAKDSKTAYASLNTEVKEGDQVIISKQEALKTSMTGVKEAGNLSIGILKQQEEAAYKAMDALEGKSGFANLRAAMSDAEKQWLASWENMRAASMKEVDTVSEHVVKVTRTMTLPVPQWGDDLRTMYGMFVETFDEAGRKIERTFADRTMTVYVNEVMQRAAGGLIGGYRSGGLIQKLATGGSVRNILSGGFLSGFGGGDRRLLLGEDGEVMLNKSVVRSAGLRAALAFNAGRFDIVMSELSKRVRDRIGFNMGGLIGSLPPLPAFATGGLITGSTGSQDTMTLNLNFGPGRSYPVSATKLDAARIRKEFIRMDRMRSA